jgi:hypothetical protein
LQCAVWVRSVIAKQVDQRELHAAFARNAAGTNQPECLIHSELFSTGIQNHIRHFNSIVRQPAMTNGIFRDEFQQRGIAKIIYFIECHTLVDELWMLLQIGAQSGCIADVEKIDGSAKCTVLNLFMEGQMRITHDRRLLTTQSSRA